MKHGNRHGAGRTSDTEGATGHALLNRGADLLLEGRIDEAIPLLERAHELLGWTAPVLLTLGGGYLLAGRFEQAIPLLETARDLEPYNAMAWLNLGAALLGNPVLASQEQQQRAIDAFEKAVGLDPDVPSGYYNLGLIFKDRGDLDSAVAAFRMALQADPGDKDARYWLYQLQKEGGLHGDNGP